MSKKAGSTQANEEAQKEANNEARERPAYTKEEDAAKNTWAFMYMHAYRNKQAGRAPKWMSARAADRRRTLSARVAERHGAPITGELRPPASKRRDDRARRAKTERRRALGAKT